MVTSIRFATLFAALGVCAAASAVPIVYRLTGTGSGSLNGVTFTNAAFSLTEISDTSLVTFNSGVYASLPPTAVSVTGVGSDALTNVQAFVNPGLQFGGFSNSPTPSAGVLAGITSSGFAGYDLKSFIGPVTGTSTVNPPISFPTRTGSLTLSAGSGFVFTATPVPEPASFAALGLGTVALLCRRKRA